jgi:hypothetical protein
MPKSKILIIPERVSISCLRKGMEPYIPRLKARGSSARFDKSSDAFCQAVIINDRSKSKK